MDDPHSHPLAVPSDDDTLVNGSSSGVDDGGKPAARRSRRRRSSVEREQRASVSPRSNAEEQPTSARRAEAARAAERQASPRVERLSSASQSIASVDASVHPEEGGLINYSSAEIRAAAKQFRWSDDVGFALAEVRAPHPPCAPPSPPSRPFPHTHARAGALLRPDRLQRPLGDAGG